MIKVLLDNYIFDTTPHGGIARYFREIIPRISELYPDISFDIICTLENINAYPKGKNITYHFMPRPWRPNMIFWRINDFKHKTYPTKIAKKVKPDIFHSTYYQPPLSKDIRNVVSVHDFIDRSLSCLATNKVSFLELQANAINEADAIVCVSEATKNDLLKFFTQIDKNIAHVIHHGVNDDFCSDSICKRHSGLANISPYFLYVGNRGSYKNFTSLLTAFAKISHNSNINLLAIGGENSLSEHQRELIISNNIEDRVILTGILPNEVLHQYYSSAVAFVFPSLKEGFGMPILEAMAAGVPVLVSDIQVFHEVAGDAALYFDPHRIDDIAAKLKKIITPETSILLRKRGTERIALFSWDKAATEMANVYRKILKQ